MHKARNTLNECRQDVCILDLEGRGHRTNKDPKMMMSLVLLNVSIVTAKMIEAVKRSGLNNHHTEAKKHGRRDFKKSKHQQTI